MTSHCVAISCCPCLGLTLVQESCDLLLRVAIGMIAGSTIRRLLRFSSSFAVRFQSECSCAKKDAIMSSEIRQSPDAKDLSFRRSVTGVETLSSLIVIKPLFGGAKNSGGGKAHVICSFRSSYVIGTAESRNVIPGIRSRSRLSGSWPGNPCDEPIGIG